MNKSIMLVWAIKNIVCWTYLAVMFNKWWVALFGLLFMSSLQTQGQYYKVCDKCGKHSEYADSYNKALDKAKNNGWVHCVDGNRDYCPDCKE